MRGVVMLVQGKSAAICHDHRNWCQDIGTADVGGGMLHLQWVSQQWLDAMQCGVHTLLRLPKHAGQPQSV